MFLVILGREKSTVGEVVRGMSFRSVREVEEYCDARYLQTGLRSEVFTSDLKGFFPPEQETAEVRSRDEGAVPYDDPALEAGT